MSLGSKPLAFSKSEGLPLSENFSSKFKLLKFEILSLDFAIVSYTKLLKPPCETWSSTINKFFFFFNILLSAFISNGLYELILINPTFIFF